MAGAENAGMGMGIPFGTYSSVPNRRAVRNKRAGGKILKKH